MTMSTTTTASRRAGMLLLMAATLAGCGSLCPRDALPPPPSRRPHAGPPRDPAMAAAIHACLEELGEPGPDPAAGPAGKRPSPEERQALDACLRGKGIQPPPPRDPAFDAAFQACGATLGLPDDRGPPSPGDRMRMDACLKEKGIERPAPPAGEPPSPAD